MKKLWLKISLLSTIFMLMICEVSSGLMPKEVMPVQEGVLSNLAIDIIRITVLLIAIVVIMLLVLKIKEKLSHNTLIISSIVIVFIIFGCIVGVNRQNKVYADYNSGRPLLIRIFDFSQW